MSLLKMHLTFWFYKSLLLFLIANVRLSWTYFTIFSPWPTFPLTKKTLTNKNLQRITIIYVPKMHKYKICIKNHQTLPSGLLPNATDNWVFQLFFSFIMWIPCLIDTRIINKLMLRNGKYLSKIQVMTLMNTQVWTLTNCESSYNSSAIRSNYKHQKTVSAFIH